MAKTAKELTSEVKAEKYDEGATELKNLYDSYVRAGFTEEQAWELVTIMVSNGTKRTLF